MHDGSDVAEMRRGNTLLDMVKVLIPQLFEMNYRFVRLDGVPAISALSTSSPACGW